MARPLLSRRGVIRTNTESDNTATQKLQSGHTRLELGMANCVVCCVGIILSGLQYRFSSCRGSDVDINHDEGDLCMTKVLGQCISI